MLGSKSNYFHQSDFFLISQRIMLENHLINFQKKKGLIEMYLTAFDYCCENKDFFDGATCSEDLYPKHLRLDYRAMLHDYLYSILKCNASYEYIKIANEIYYSEMRDDGVSGVYIWWQRTRLNLVSSLYVTYNKYVLKKKQNQVHKKKINDIYTPR